MHHDRQTKIARLVIMVGQKKVDPQYLSSFPYYSRHGQDKYLHQHVFGDSQGGFFVDIGAYDGVESSNTLFFEESLKWAGVCVEPLPEAFSRLCVHRNCLCINTCASDRYEKAEFTHVRPEKAITREGQTRTSNFEKMSGLTRFYSTEHDSLIEQALSRTGGRREFFETDCTPINDILARLPSSRIDLFSLDTEGSELHILQAIDFARFQIRVFAIEELFAEDRIALFMQQKGYVPLTKIGYDRIYVCCCLS